MEIHRYNVWVADYDLNGNYPPKIKIERVASIKKPNFVIEAYHEYSDADCLISIRLLDWWTDELLPSFIIDTKDISKRFYELGYRIDFVP